MARQDTSSRRGTRTLWPAVSRCCSMTPGFVLGWAFEEDHWSRAPIRSARCWIVWKPSIRDLVVEGKFSKKRLMEETLSEWSSKQLVVFWWVLFLAIQQVERLFLLP